MKKIGLVGGTGYESTLVYYRELNRIVNKNCGGAAFPEIAIESVDLCRALRYVAEDDTDSLTEYILEKLGALAAGGADFAALTAGTMHIVFDRLRERSPLPLIGIPQAIRAEAEKRGLHRVGLLGTLATMEKDFFKKTLTDSGIEVVIPEKADRELVFERITSELELGIVKDSTRKELLEITGKMQAEHGIEAVILGCTELPLILNEECCPLPVLDIMDIHIHRLAELIYN